MSRVIQDRLDDVLGVMGWQDSYECLPDGSVVCRLRIRLGTEWITKEDVGGQSEQPDEGDRRKAAFSDALKRAAVKFGIGRYLYRLKPQWVDYDPQKRQLIGTPRLPVVIVAATSPAPLRSKRPPWLSRLGSPRKKAARARPPALLLQPHRLPGESQPTGWNSNADWRTRTQRLPAKDFCKPGELLRHIMDAGVKAGHGED